MIDQPSQPDCKRQKHYAHVLLAFKNPCQSMPEAPHEQLAQDFEAQQVNMLAYELTMKILRQPCKMASQCISLSCSRQVQT